MFGRKKQPAPAAPKKGGGEKLMAQMGISHLGGDPTDMASMEAMIYGDDDDDDLEAELAALQGNSYPEPRRAAKKPDKSQMNMAAIDKMVAASMKDVADSDEDVSDIDDPDLLAELQRLSTDRVPEPASVPVVQETPPRGVGDVDVIEGRLSMYQMAMENAKASGDTSKARRLDRGIKNLRDLLRQAKSGKPIAEEDIPPPVSLSAHPTPVSSPMKEQATLPSPANVDSTGGYSPRASPNLHPPSPERRPPSPANTGVATHPARIPSLESPSSESGDIRRGVLVERRDQYRKAALAAKRGGDNNKARQYAKVAKQFDTVLSALDGGHEVDLSQMPPPPEEFKVAVAPAREVARTQGSGGPTQAELANAAATAVASRAAASEQVPEEQVPDLSIEDQKKLFNAPTEARTILEALEQRLEKYQASCNQAKGEGNNSKARRMGRIVKQYQDAVKAHKAGKPVDYSELPSPPGFPPIPADGPAKQPPPTPSPLLSPSPSNSQISPQVPVAAPRSPQGHKPPPRQEEPKPAPSSRPPMQRQMSLLSRNEQQCIFLQERQLAFKKEALKCKEKGDIELAKKYLRQAMGFDKMIEAAKSGLPVDMSQVPSLPGAENERFEFISTEECQEPTGDREEMYKKLEQELISQIRTCTTNSDHFTKLGDVASASKFDKIGANARKDFDALKNAFKHGDPVPRFHYETRTYTLVKSCSDLGDNDFELIFVRGINYHLPSDYAPTDLDTYVKYEFPFPNDDPQKGYSETVKSTNNPEYNQTIKLNANRKSRSFLRLLKNKSIKLEVFYKRGFFKGDKTLGTVSVKLQPLEHSCILHESFDLMDGRKTLGGKLEVKLRIREPYLNKQVEEVKEKWLIIDHYERALQGQGSNAASAGVSRGGGFPTGNDVTSMEVLKYEKQLLDRQIQQMAGRLSRTQEDMMKQKSQQLTQKVEEQREQIRRGGMYGLRDYADAIERSKAIYLQEAHMLAKQGNREKAQILVTKKKLVEKEVEAIRAKLPRS